MSGEILTITKLGGFSPTSLIAKIGNYQIAAVAGNLATRLEPITNCEIERAS